MSPIPSIMSLMASPKQQITKNVFIKPYESPTAETAGKTYNYFFNRSASKVSVLVYFILNILTFRIVGSKSNKYGNQRQEKVDG